MFKKFKTLLISALLVCFCVPCFAYSSVKTGGINDFIPSFIEEIFIGTDKEGNDEKTEIVVDESKSVGVSEDDKEKDTDMDKNKKTETDKETDKDKKTVEVKSLDLIVILDRSGSMYGLENDTIGGVNSMLDEQRKLEVPVKVTIVEFNNKVDILKDRIDVKEVQNLTKEDYVPQGTTALLDAMGNTLSKFKANEEVNAEGNRVLVVVTTDGKENASKEWTKEKVKQLVSELEKEFKYEFVFLGADIDAVSAASSVGINPQRSMKFKKTSAGVQANFKAVNVMMNSLMSGESLETDAKWRDSVVEDKN